MYKRGAHLPLRTEFRLRPTEQRTWCPDTRAAASLRLRRASSVPCDLTRALSALPHVRPDAPQFTELRDLRHDEQRRASECAVGRARRAASTETGEHVHGH